jgi:hypothetical protein
MKLSKEQIEELQRELSVPWGQVELLCDGRRVSLQVRRFKGMTYRVMTYVDGVFKAEWCIAGTAAPEAKFLRKSVRPLVSLAKRKKFEKELGKRWVAKSPYCNGTVTIYLPDWSSGKVALSHLCKVCESVEIAPIEDKREALADARAPIDAEVRAALDLEA